MVNTSHVISCGFSWVLYENKEYSGNMYVLSEGDYPNLTSMGCPPSCSIRSLKAVPVVQKNLDGNRLPHPFFSWL